ncbi:30S ribosomal protein S18 [candidate division TA06 bacterium DG_26]|uniref:Small ribosomal subunit protein bS18 n=1 Tax=candidate division TA06 bacterium DG_26 TaxID=1703771 RepID=A0A0S7WG78_UNCT6|nr:MAG: 30S ribosomal protein S18 [candidate division TA06 bacterium DG_26]
MMRERKCYFCTQNEQIDYKDVAKLRRYMSEKGKILPRRITGACAKHQRKVTKAIRKARIVALLPFVGIARR